jgi:tetratricopeptide (TPR) repeat protein
MLAALLLALAPAPALAQRGGRSAKELIEQGERLYQQRRYEEAAQALVEANALSPHPRLIYNIARAYDQAGKVPEALQHYQEYMASPEGTDPTLLKRAALSIDRLRLQQQKEEAAAQEAEAERKRLREQAEAQRRRAEEEAEAARRAEEANRLQPKKAYEGALASRSRARVGSFALGGLGLAGVGAGVLFGLQARSARDDFKAATTLEGKQTAADDTRGKALLADIGFGVGVASAVAAVLLYPKGPEPAKPGEARLTLAPRGAGAGLEVSF